MKHTPATLDRYLLRGRVKNPDAALDESYPTHIWAGNNPLAPKAIHPDTHKRAPRPRKEK